jgi:tetratricopeptide (TPR) repeat protein
MTLPSRLCASVLLALLWSAPSSLRADETGGDACPPPRTLKKCGELGERYFQSGQYPQAIEAFRQAYVLKPVPLFLYNIAQAHRLTGQGEDAIRIYERFLQEDPKTPFRADVERHLAELRSLKEQAAEKARKQQEEEQAAARAASSGAPQSPSVVLTAAPAPAKKATPIYKRWWFWTAISAVVVAGVGVGIGVGVARRAPAGTQFPAVTF